MLCRVVLNTDTDSRLRVGGGGGGGGGLKGNARVGLDERKSQMGKSEEYFKYSKTSLFSNKWLSEM